MVDVQNAAGRTLPCGLSEIAGWAETALEELETDVGSSLCIRFVDRDEGRRLNLQFARKDSATNVLAFAGDGASSLGDIAICVDISRDEAETQRKPWRDHLAHLVIHGTLHLQGYDHLTPVDALKMESRETKILESVGIADPYVSRG